MRLSHSPSQDWDLGVGHHRILWRQALRSANLHATPRALQGRGLQPQQSVLMSPVNCPVSAAETSSSAVVNQNDDLELFMAVCLKYR